MKHEGEAARVRVGAGFATDGVVLRQQRRALKLTVERLAALTNPPVPFSSIAAFERGERSLSATQLDAIRQVLARAIDDPS